MAIVMFLTLPSFVVPTVAVEQSVVILDDAMHFIVRHWHSDVDEDAQLQGGQADQNGDFFVVVEGYIVPRDEGGFTFYLVNQAENSPETLIPVDDDFYSPYLDSVDVDQGIIKLAIKPLTDDGDPVEIFSGVSVSAGHSAIKYDSDFITITYDPYVHLVKGHVFYMHKSKIVTGTNDEVAFAGTGLFDNPEIDTAWAYTYSDGRLVMSRADSSRACTSLDDLPLGVSEGQVTATRFYSTAEGLHTDNTVIARDSNSRTFLYDLEAWYIEGYAPQVGMILDASGSMAFASDTPTVISLSAKQMEDLGITQYKGASDPNNEDGGWDKYFLTEAQVNKILNKNKTDNSPRGVSGYSYFVFDSNENTLEYAPIGYWEGAVIKANTKIGFTVSSDNVTTGWPGDHSDLDMDSKKGLHTSGVYTANNNTKNPSKTGIMLDVAVPTNGEFTISFTMSVAGTGDPSDAANRKIAELLYIGPLTGTTDAGNYYRLFRDQGSSAARLRANQNPDRNNFVTDINSVFITNTEAEKRVTLVFKNGTVTSYIDGAVGSNGTITNVEVPCVLDADSRIIFNPARDSYEGAAIHINNVYVFNTALTEAQVASTGDWDSSDALIGLYHFANSTPRPDPNDNTSRNWLLNSAPQANGAFASKITEQQNIFNNDVDPTVPTIAKTASGVILGSLQNGTIDGGWFYVTHSNSWADYTSASLGTAKRLVGLGPSTTTANPDGTVADVIDGNGDSGYSYTAKDNSPIRFYVDKNGNLRCFFSRGASAAPLASYVYELGDSQYVKSEALQRVLGSFANKLSDQSPAAQLSAVRFSSKNVTAAMSNQLLMMDWTSDITQSTELLRDFGLTGDTTTWTGLQAFYDHLYPNDCKNKKDGNDADDDAPRYLIIFTDGLDTTNDTGAGSKETARALANELKEDGYTIFTVMLAMGNVKEGSDNYDKAEQFLISLAGTKEKNGSADYFYAADNLGELVNIFVNDILSQISLPLSGYTVTDYIDPRFDLVDNQGRVWYLRSNGQVVTGDGRLVTLNENSTEVFRLGAESDPNARKPYLRFDSKRNMYYLEWLLQTVPTGSVGADRLEVWNARITLKAKGDFLGGNDILLVGNEKEMNWVHRPGDPDASSGTSDMFKTFGTKVVNGATVRDPSVVLDPYPSKGFPRTVVNVQLLPLNTKPLDDIVFEGEIISHAQILTNIEDEYITESYYLEYLRRYAYQRYLYVLESKKAADLEGDAVKIARMRALVAAQQEELNKPLIELLNDWLGIDDDDQLDKSFSVPYMYLPSVAHNEDGTIQLGSDGYAADILNNYGDITTHGEDVIGILTFRWHQIEPGEAIRDYVKTDTERMQYSLTVEFTPLKKGDSLAGLNAADDKGEDIFAAYLPIEGTGGKKSEFENVHGATFPFDRAAAYVNSSLIRESSYKWDPVFKPASNTDPYHAGELQPTTTADYGTGQVLNHGRTLTALSVYTQDVVSGGIALELKLLIGELRELYGIEALDNVADSELFTAEIKLNATRRFTDTDLSEKNRAEKDLGDYGETFTFTFELKYTGKQLKALTKEAEADEYGYVTVFAKATKITGTFNNSPITLHDLPIGTYEFSLEDANTELGKSSLKDKLHFAEMTCEDKDSASQFEAAYAYFDEIVRNGLNTTNEDPRKWRTVEKDGKVVEDYTGRPEITSQNIKDYIAEAKSTDKKSATFYIGTSSKTDPKRGSLGTDRQDPARYTNDRLGILRLSTGMTMLTIEEKGADAVKGSTESFLYRITGKTLGDKDVDLIVTVHGNSSTTVMIAPGNYTVTELHDWSWRYKNVDTYDTLSADSGDDGLKYTRKNGGDWDVDTATMTSAYTELRYRDDLPEVLQHHYVTFEHARNDKVWLGGENYADNRFNGEQ